MLVYYRCQLDYGHQTAGVCDTVVGNQQRQRELSKEVKNAHTHRKRHPAPPSGPSTPYYYPQSTLFGRWYGSTNLTNCQHK